VLGRGTRFVGNCPLSACMQYCYSMSKRELSREKWRRNRTEGVDENGRRGSKREVIVRDGLGSRQNGSQGPDVSIDWGIKHQQHNTTQHTQHDMTPHGAQNTCNTTRHTQHNTHRGKAQ
jgi:hypothetical protein